MILSLVDFWKNPTLNLWCWSFQTLHWTGHYDFTRRSDSPRLDQRPHLTGQAPPLLPPPPPLPPPLFPPARPEVLYSKISWNQSWTCQGWQRQGPPWPLLPIWKLTWLQFWNRHGQICTLCQWWLPARRVTGGGHWRKLNLCLHNDRYHVMLWLGE